MRLRDKIIDGAKTVGRTIDAVASQISPKWGLRRKYRRQMLDAEAGYDGSTRGRRSSGWRESRLSANREIARSMVLLRSRARDLVRNNTYAARAASVYRSHVIGTGIRPSYKQDSEFDDRVDAFSLNPKLDVQGRKNLFAMQSLGEEERFTGGEIFFRREWITSSEQERLELEFPFRVRMLEAEYLDRTVDGPVGDDGNIAVKGVEVNPSGEIVAYHFYDRHPHGYHWQGTPPTRRVPAHEVIHVFDQQRTGQVRGVTDLAPVMLKLRDFRQYEDVQLIRQKMAASFVAFRRQTDYEATAESTLKEDSVLKPGRVETLGPGEDVEFANPPEVRELSDYARVSLRAIATGVDLTYEQLASDYSQVNFTSGRMGNIEFQRKKERLQQQVWIPQFCWKFDQWVREAALFEMFDIDERARWSVPENRMVDPVKETDAKRKKIRDGISTPQQEVERTGRDWHEHLEEYQRNMEELDEAGVITDSDARNTTQGGQTPSRVTEQMRAEQARGGQASGGPMARLESKIN